jgi:phosphohistidine phosphatase
MDSMAHRLILVRHGKAQDEGSAPTDHGRDLVPRGRKEAALVGEALRAQNWVPELILVSDALRTRETYAAMAWPARIPVQFEAALYLSRIGAMRRQVATLNDKVHAAMIVGHNPGLEAFAEWLTGAPEYFKTGDALLLTAEDQSWAELMAEPGQLKSNKAIRSARLLEEAQ